MSTEEKLKEVLLIQVRNYLIATKLDVEKLDGGVQRVAELLDQIVNPPPDFRSWV